MSAALFRQSLEIVDGVSNKKDGNENKFKLYKKHNQT